MPAREFDLNIERVLENWTLAHAIREFIANALHEVAHAVSGTPDVSGAFEDALTAETGTVAERAIRHC